MQDGERVEPATLAEAAPEVLRCGECEARVSETREDGSRTKRIRCGVSRGRIVCAGCMCSADTADLERAHAQLGRELERRKQQDLLCGPGGTRPTDDAEADAVE